MTVDRTIRRRRRGAGHAPEPPPGTVGDPPLRGRDAEVADLTGAIARLRDGRGGIRLVEGDPGSGRTRLVREARAVAESLPVRVLSGTGRPDQQVVPFGALLEVLLSDGRPVVDEGLLRTLSDSAEQRFWLFRTMRCQLEQAALDRPLLLVLDDLHWCDAGTLTALRTLPARLSSHALLWLVTVRTGALDTDVRAAVSGLSDAGARTIRLGPLPPDGGGRDRRGRGRGRALRPLA
ncbi:ATP-binding protein [Actinomadura syzygii]|uniref:ATP-binding protein n=1 Tax=Actinomadura syzygii TaxID=1427538 RepID=A0A5D0UA33_9ACTN|nr:ATP-binding protein [Actinomadura syzygii]TYC15421.1 ATP-binding protein [Actinomadura syzygii]